MGSSSSISFDLYSQHEVIIVSSATSSIVSSIETRTGVPLEWIYTDGHFVAMLWKTDAASS